VSEFVQNMGKLTDEGQSDEETGADARLRGNNDDGKHLDDEDQKEKSRARLSADYEVSEITYNFTVTEVPAEFQSENLKLDLRGLSGNDDDEEEESEEEFTETIDEIIYPLRSSNDFGSPRRIPDLHSPKEHHNPVPFSLPPQPDSDGVSIESEREENTAQEQTEEEEDEEEEKVFALFFIYKNICTPHINTITICRIFSFD
jgi:hypothetical protein